MDLVSDSAVITELERNFKIDEKILKFMTIKKEDAVDLKEIEKEIAAASAPSQRWKVLLRKRVRPHWKFQKLKRSREEANKR